jgi:hypothetical protein
MSTPKLKIHRLSENRPAPSDAQLLTFFKVDGSVHLHCGGLHTASDPFIRIPCDGDCNRFYVDPGEVGDFLLDHDLLEVPALVDHEAEAYKEAHTKWLASPARNCSSEFFAVVRRPFIQALVEDKGFAFKQEKYLTLC